MRNEKSRELLKQTVIQMMEITNNIYIGIDWELREVSHEDHMLVELFNTNVDLIQLYLDFLYPERQKGAVKKLHFVRGPTVKTTEGRVDEKESTKKYLSEIIDNQYKVQSNEK